MVSGVMFSVTCGNTTLCVCECLRNVNVAIKSAVCDYNCSSFVLIVSDFFSDQPSDTRNIKNKTVSTV